MSNAESKRESSGARWPWVAVVMIAGLGYVLSYAPMVKIKGGWAYGNGTITVSVPFDGDRLPFYRPLDWVIDSTPLKAPLFIWAGQWGVRDIFERAHGLRDLVSQGVTSQHSWFRGLPQATGSAGGSDFSRPRLHDDGVGAIINITSATPQVPRYETSPGQAAKQIKDERRDCFIAAAPWLHVCLQGCAGYSA